MNTGFDMEMSSLTQLHNYGSTSTMLNSEFYGSTEDHLAYDYGEARYTPEFDSLPADFELPYGSYQDDLNQEALYARERLQFQQSLPNISQHVYDRGILEASQPQRGLQVGFVGEIQSTPNVNMLSPVVPSLPHGTVSRPPPMPQGAITQETIDKLHESEHEDILMTAKDITDPDPAANMSFATKPARVVDGSFRHPLSVKEVYSKTGAFKHRTIEIQRHPDDDLGFSVRQGDGWEKSQGIYISRVNLGSVFDLYELMTVGDEIIKINKVDIRSMSVDDAVRLMHIPEKLSITVKILTPFSKKRVSKSTIADDQKGAKKFSASGKRNFDSNYKIANMKIGKSNADIVTTKNEETKTTTEQQTNGTVTTVANGVNAQQKSPAPTTGRSPYRVGASQRQLSPIREVNSEIHINKQQSNVHVSRQARRSSVTWSDQRSVVSEPWGR